jgi:hypothetical protein
MTHAKSAHIVLLCGHLEKHRYGEATRLVVRMCKTQLRLHRFRML